MNFQIISSLGTAFAEFMRKSIPKAPAGSQSRPRPFPFHDATAREREILAAIAPFTMTSVERQYALLKAVQYIDKRGIPGDIVECGVWRGGNIMLAKMARERNHIPRRYFLFDTFRGMSAPTQIDIDYAGEAATQQFADRDRGSYNEWCYAPREEVERNLSSVGLSSDEIICCEGRVEDTLRDPANLPAEIAILRLDTDWYESTHIELEVLYPKLLPGGVLIVDDYGDWLGARRAVDEYFLHMPLLMIAVDSSGRVAIKA